jgi:hypothetical protein
MAGALWAMTRAGERSGEDGRPAVVARAQVVGAGTDVTLQAGPAGDEPDDQAERVAARAAESDLAPVTMVIDLSDAALALDAPDADEPLRLVETLEGDLAGGTADEVDRGLDLPLEPQRSAGEHDLRRIAVLICAGAAVITLVGLPFLVDRTDDEQVAQVGVATEAGLLPPDMSSTTIMGQPSIKVERSQPRVPARRPRTVTTTPRRTATTLPSRSGTISPSTRLPLGGGSPIGPTATTAPPTATTAPPTPTTTAPPTPTTEPPPTTTTTASTTTTTQATTTTTTAPTIP